MYNKHIIIGRLGNAVELKTVNNGLAVSKFSVVTSRKTNKEKSDWHNIVCFGKLAEIAQKYFKKGMLVMVEGESQNNNYTTKEGEKRYSTQLLAEKIIKLSYEKQDSKVDQDLDKQLEKELSGDSSLDDIPF